MNGQALMKYRFDILLNFLGTGDINTAKIWFMGIEEAQVWTKDSIHEIDLLETVLSKTLRPGSIPEQKSKLPHNE